MSRTYTDRTRGAQTIRPPQRMNPNTGMSEELPREAERNLSPTRREPRRTDGYTVIPPDEKKRQDIQRQAEQGMRKYEEHKAANRPCYSIVATLGGGDGSPSGASATAETQRRLPRELTAQQKIQKYKEDKKKREDKEYEEKKQAARKKAEENERRDKERQERVREEAKRNEAARLDRLEGKSSSGDATGRQGDASSSTSASSASASGGVKEGNEKPEFVDALVQLESMFPLVDKEVLKSLLKEAGNNVDEVVQFLS